MFFDLHGASRPRSTLFNALVAPRPIAWVSTVNAQGVANLAPFSYFNLLTSSPPTTVFSCTAPGDRAEKDTLANIKATGEFVINLVSRELLDSMHGTSAMAPSGVDEFELMGIEREASTLVRPPRVSAAPAALECRVLQYIDIRPDRAGDSHATAILGRVVGVHVKLSLLDANGRFDTVRAQLVTRLGGNLYAEIGAITELPSLVHDARPPLAGS